MSNALSHVSFGKSKLGPVFDVFGDFASHQRIEGFRFKSRTLYEPLMCDILILSSYKDKTYGAIKLLLQCPDRKWRPKQGDISLTVLDLPILRVDNLYLGLGGRYPEIYQQVLSILIRCEKARLTTPSR